MRYHVGFTADDVDRKLLRELVDAAEFSELKMTADTKEDKPKKSSPKQPRNLKELMTIRAKIRAAKKRGSTQKEAIREHVEYTYKKLTTDEQIKTKAANLARYLRLYKHLLK